MRKKVIKIVRNGSNISIYGKLKKKKSPMMIIWIYNGGDDDDERRGRRNRSKKKRNLRIHNNSRKTCKARLLTGKMDPWSFTCCEVMIRFCF